MIRRTTWILLAILVVVGALAWYFELSPSAKQAEATPSATAAPTANLLPGLNSLTVTHIAFSGAEGKDLAVSMNSESKYVFDKQPQQPVNQGAAFQLASELASIKVTSTVSTSDSMDSLGLAQPALVIAVENANGKKYEVKLGSETPIGNGYYVQVNSDAPVVVSKSAMEAVIALSTLDALVAPTPTPALTQTPASGGTTPTP